jgi:hypothetical protein
LENWKFKRANGSIFGADAPVNRLASAIWALGFSRLRTSAFDPQRQ